MNNSNRLTSRFWLDDFAIEIIVVPVNDKNISCVNDKMAVAAK